MTKWDEHYVSLPRYWREVIDLIIQGRIDCYKLATVIPRFKSKNEEIIFWYYVYKDYRLTKQAAKCGTRRIHEALLSFANDHVLPGDKMVGRPAKLTEEAKCIIKTAIESDRRTTHSKLKRVLLENHIDLSIGSINMAIHQMRFLYKPPKVKQLLTEVQKQRRLTFAYSMLLSSGRQEIDLKKIIFSDESRFCKGPDNRYLWRKYGESSDDLFQVKEKFPDSIMVFGAIGFGYKSPLVIVSGTEDTGEYIRILEQCGVVKSMNDAFGTGGYIFQQDGAPSHTSKAAIEYLKWRLRYLAMWPANSCDLNVIENIWGLMKRVVNSMEIYSQADLIQTLHTIWNTIPQSTINSLVSSYKYRLKLTIDLSGESIQDHIRHNRDNFDYNVPETPLDVIVVPYSSLVDGLLPLSNMEVIIDEQIEWTKAEDLLLITKHFQLGNKWKEITIWFPSRNANEIKSRYNILKKKM